MTATAVPFDIAEDLPAGITVLEASAGTGKTATIADLAARYVADGTPLERVLLVTFTRAATGELRERVRHRLQAVERALGADMTLTDDALISHLRNGTQEEVEVRRRRLALALTAFDAATIATIHAFCREVLGGLGVEGDLEPDVEFVEDLGDLVAEVVDDLYVRRFARRDELPPYSRRDAGTIAAAAIANADAPVAPAAIAADEMRVRLAEAVRDELEARKRHNRVMSWDDLLIRLRDDLRGPRGDEIARRLRGRYDVALVDEFQDTDPVQWEIMRSVFGEGERSLVLIGDPKQAIYAFRGADVYAYLEAVHAAPTQRTLEVNRRSDQGLVDAYDALFDGARLGHPEIAYREVRAAPAHQRPRLRGAPVAMPLRVRVVDRNHPAVEQTQTGLPRAPSTRAYIAEDLASDVVALLESGAEVDDEPVRPRHLAVLVRTNASALDIRAALSEAGVPAVVAGSGSVFATTAARDWLWLLTSLERPAAVARARRAALTPFLGWTADRVATADDAGWEEVHRRLHEWARVLRSRGVAAAMQTITLAERLPERLLAAPDGERELTDLRHVGELLHAAASQERLGLTALTGWLRRRIDEAERDTEQEERTRRLDSDAEAVQVLTVHRAKGLEFPIVYAPALWEAGREPDRDKPKPLTFHDAAAGDRRTVDVGLRSTAYDDHREQAIVEQRGEDLRLLYVALTRARHQAVVWWAGAYNAEHSPLGRLLFARDPDGTVRPAGSRRLGDEQVMGRLGEVAARAPEGCISVEWARLPPLRRWSGEPAGAEDLEAAAFDRSLDRRWRRTSYSALTAPAHEARVGSEPEEGVLDDEPEADAPPGAAAAGTLDEALSASCPLGVLPAGVEVGTLVHRLLERADFAAGDLEAELAARLAEVQARRTVDAGDPAVLVAGLRDALETPLGPTVGGIRLADLGRADRLDELGFELPLVGGDDPAATLTLARIAGVLRAHLPAGDPLAAYPDRLEALGGSARGYLTGSLDLVARLPDGRFAIVDYKTNRLAAPEEPLTVWHHRPAALAAEMGQRHYGLQALLYAVALHRYLRWRRPGYDPGAHLAGVLYLFVRGMTGPGTPVIGGAPAGVFAWSPQAALLEALSEVFDAG